MKTALEIAQARAEQLGALRNVIPAMTNPLGKHWKQPDRQNIQVDETHATMSQRDFDQLKEYSASEPTGAYPGKMWKCRHKDNWFLVWFALDKDPGFVASHWRKIRIQESAGK